MLDIFLSYAREDEPRARALATTLEARGWSVWWDRRIPHGKDFNAYIQQQLDDARCIVVLWSKASVASQFVRDEATEGLNGRLVPALIEQVKQPLGFRQLHAANLSDWDGEHGHDEFEWLVGSITALTPPSSVAATAHASTVTRTSKPIRVEPILSAHSHQNSTTPNHLTGESEFGTDAPPRSIQLERGARSRIFVSYRREDSAGHVLALLPALRERFGADRLFKDSEQIDPGQDFVKVMQREQQSCAVMIAVIGRDWATVNDPRTKRRRLDNPNDFLRVEIAAALANEHVVVMPVLVDGAEMPRNEDLPADLQPLVSRYALDVSDRRWDVGVDRLIRAIERVIGNLPSKQ